MLTTTEPRRFYLDRQTDITGASGTGRVADGVLWPDGSATVRWRGEHGSVVHWERFESVEIIHGHNGATVVVWVDLHGDGVTLAPEFEAHRTDCALITCQRPGDCACADRAALHGSPPGGAP